MRYLSSPDFRHDGAERIGVLLANSGTPDSPSVGDVRRFLARFLGDPRVIELPRTLWLPILHGLILRTRPRQSARKYGKIWTPQGSPLAVLSHELRSRLTSTLAERVLAPFSLELGMLYSRPTIADGLERLRALGAQRILVVPLFPQYCGASTGSVYDQVSKELGRWRWLPELRFVAGYHDYPGYIEALRTTVQQHWQAHGRTRHLLVSFHGVPERYFHDGDPYYCKCQKTARLLADELMLKDDEWSVSFQSRVGPAKWLQPYTSEVVAQLPARGVSELTMICPGFALDCLETLEEVNIEYRQRFLEARGSRFEYVPALNAQLEHARFLADLIAQHCQGWTHVELGFRPAGAARGASA
jgi:protoporphyrin/coproporphyrin ferrochelatase